MLDVSCVEIGKFNLGDLLYLGAGHRADDLSADLTCPLLDASCFLKQHGGGRGLQDEVKGTVLVDRNLDGDDHPHLVACAIVELLDELGDVDAVRTKCGTDRRRWCRLPGRALQFDLACDFFGHIGSGDSPLPWCCHKSGGWLSLLLVERSATAEGLSFQAAHLVSVMGGMWWSSVVREAVPRKVGSPSLG